MCIHAREKLNHIRLPHRQLFNSYDQNRDQKLSRKQFRTLMRHIRVNLTQQQVSLLLLRFVVERRPQPGQRDKDGRDHDIFISWYEFEILCGVCSDLIQQNASSLHGARGGEYASSMAAVSGKVRRFFAERVLMRGEAGDDELNVFDDMDLDGDGVLSHVEFEASPKLKKYFFCYLGRQVAIHRCRVV